jgi:small subunit ribosomal protein S6
MSAGSPAFYEGHDRYHSTGTRICDMAQKYQYELTYVISGVVKQNQVDDIVRKVNHLIESNDGDVLEVDEWGNQRLAYEIDRKRSGYYVNMYFQAPGELIERLERELDVNDDVLRYLTLRMDAKMQRHYEKRKQRRAQEAAEEEDEAGDE